jgi:hypothetical protein
VEIFAINQAAKSMVRKTSPHDQVKHSVWSKKSVAQLFVIELTVSEFSADLLRSAPF